MIGEVGKRIKSAREHADLSQQKLADVLGVHVMQVSKWERGAALPNADSLDALAGALGVSVDYMLGRTDDPAGAIFESDLSDDERRIVALVRRRDLPALLREVTNIAEDAEEQRIGGGNQPALDESTGGEGE